MFSSRKLIKRLFDIRKRFAYRKSYVSFMLVLVLGIFSACQQLEAAATDDTLIAQAVAEGIIISPDVLRGAQMAFRTEAAEEGRLYRNMSTSVSLHFPNTADLSFERGGGRLSSRNAISMQFVQAGDVLMSVSFDEDLLMIEEQQLTLRMGEAQRRHESERARRRANIEDFRNNLHADMNEFDLQIHALRLESMEAEYQHMIHNFNIQRRDNNRQLEEIREMIQGEDLIAPFDGVISWTDTARVGTVIEDWMVMVTIYDHYGFQLEARASADIMRYGDTMMVVDRDDVPHAVRVVSDPLVDSSERTHQFTFILEPIDPDTDAYYFFQPNLNAQPYSVDLYGLLVPSRAVNTADARRYVYVYEGGVIRRRYIQVGFFYMGLTQVLDGLDAGQLVVLN